MRILKHLKPGKIILLHDSEKAAVNMLHALEALLEYALKRGYRFEAMPYKKGSA
jgi:peptidoglycan/xylan/chitin deacetylase (PgdA/CDA1 family)